MKPQNAIPLVFLLALTSLTGCGREDAAGTSTPMTKSAGGGGGRGELDNASRTANNEMMKSKMTGGGGVGLVDKTAAPLDQNMEMQQPTASGGRSGGPMAGSEMNFQRKSASLYPQTATVPPPVSSPNMYISSTYMGGSGAKDRIEKLINEGVLVDGKRVKLEAFSRNYAQAFPIPSNTALAVTVDTERSKIVQEGDHTYLQVGLQAMKGESPRRPPLNITLVIDRSGSMEEEGKLENAKAAAIQLVDRLNASDIFSLVVFDDNVDLLIPARRVSNKESIKRKIAALVPGGGTNIFDGLRMGYREAEKSASPDSISRLILLSDGQVSAGTTDIEQFKRLSAAESDKDIQTTTVGLGIDFNEDLMLSVAREGKGNYHFIKDGSDTRRVFSEELGELTHIVARAVKLRICLAEGIGLVRVLGAKTLDAGQTRQVKAEEKKIDRKVADELGISTNRQTDKDEPGIKLLIPNFYRGDNHVVMLEVAVPKGRGSRKIADVFVKYKDVLAKANRNAVANTSITYTPNRSEMIAGINRNVKKNLLGFQTGEALADAASLIEQGSVSQAVKKVDERMVVLGVAAREWNDKDLDRDGKLLDRYKSVLAQLQTDPSHASDEFGQYLKKSLTYASYKLTR
jgi:Ca-activated chloride channel family protein